MRNLRETDLYKTERVAYMDDNSIKTVVIFNSNGISAIGDDRVAEQVKWTMICISRFIGSRSVLILSQPSDKSLEAVSIIHERAFSNAHIRVRDIIYTDEFWRGVELHAQELGTETLVVISQNDDMCEKIMAFCRPDLSRPYVPRGYAAISDDKFWLVYPSPGG